MNFRGRVDYVYIASTKEEPNGPVKIGFTTQPWYRPGTVARSSNKRLYIAYLRPVKEGMGLAYEKRMHELLDHSALGGEWFNVSAQEAIDQITNADWYFEELLKKDINVDEKLIEFLKDEKTLRLIENNC